MSYPAPEPPIIVEPRNADLGQAPFQVADDEDTGRWYRAELVDGRVVFINAAPVSFVWADHQPPLDLRWETFHLDKEGDPEGSPVEHDARGDCTA